MAKHGLGRSAGRHPVSTVSAAQNRDGRYGRLTWGGWVPPVWPYAAAASAGLVVWGTGSGSRREPDWIQNRREAQPAQVQVRGRMFAVRPHELLHGEERDTQWRDAILARAPEVSRYAQKTGRTIPVAVLEPVGRDRQGRPSPAIPI